MPAWSTAPVAHEGLAGNAFRRGQYDEARSHVEQAAAVADVAAFNELSINSAMVRLIANR